MNVFKYIFEMMLQYELHENGENPNFASQCMTQMMPSDTSEIS